MSPTIERITSIPGSRELGEGPHWDVDTQSLYFVDIFGKSIHRYVPATKQHFQAVIGTNTVSLIIPVEGQKDTYLISVGRELVTVKWDGVSDKVTDLKKIYEVDKEPRTVGNRINDGKSDPTGRLWAGTMGPEPELGHAQLNNGSLFSFGPNKEVKKQLSSVSIANGLAWNTNLNKFYYIDSPTRTINQYDVDLDNGTISNGETIFSLDKSNVPGFGDGMTIDTDGNLWVAIFAGNRVIKIDPRKPDTLLETIHLPAKQVTSVAFGGPNLDELYVTTASFTIDGAVLSPPDHGATYRITGTGARGFPGVKVKL